eukprot:g18075.t1
MPIKPERVVSPWELYSEFQCGVCKKIVPVNNAVETDCCHQVFCAGCVGRVTTLDPHRYRGVGCANCTGQNYQPLAKCNPLAQRILNKVVIQCPLEELKPDCKWSGKYEDANAHVRDCLGKGGAVANNSPSIPSSTTARKGPLGGKNEDSDDADDTEESDEANSDTEPEEESPIAIQGMGSRGPHFIPPPRAGAAPTTTSTPPSTSSAPPPQPQPKRATAPSPPQPQPQPRPARAPHEQLFSAKLVAMLKQQIEQSKKLGNEKIAEKKYREAITQYTNAIRVFDENVARAVLLDEQKKLKKEYPAGVGGPSIPEEFTEAELTELKGAASICYSNRGFSHSQSGSYKEAIADLKESVKLNPDYTKAQLRLCQAYCESGDFEEANRRLDLIIPAEKKKLDLLLEAKKKEEAANGGGGAGKKSALSGIFVSQKKKDEEKKAMGSLLPDFISLQKKTKILTNALRNGRTNLAKGETGQAILNFREALQHSQTNLQLQMWLARSLFAAGNDSTGSDANHSECRRIIQNCLRDNRDFIEGYCMRGLTLFASDEIDKAVPLLKEALKLNPDCAEAREVFKKIIKPLCAQLENARELVKKYRYRDAIPVYKDVINALSGAATSGTGTAGTPNTSTGAGAGAPSTLFDSLSGDIDIAVRMAITRGLRRSSLLATVQADYAKCNLKIREFKAAIQAANASLALFNAGLTEQTKTAYETKCLAYLEQKLYRDALDTLENANIAEGVDDTLDDLRQRVKRDMKKGARPDYYRILSDSPSVAALVRLKEGECWKTCADTAKDEADGRLGVDSDNENETEAEKNRRLAARINIYSPANQIKTAYRRRCLELHPDKLEVRLAQFTQRNLSDFEKKKFKKSTEEHFKLVQDAYDVLSDPQKKQSYDNGKTKEEIEEDAKGGGFWGGFGGGGARRGPWG